MPSDRQCLCKCTRYARKFQKRNEVLLVCIAMRWCESVLQNEDNDNTTHARTKKEKGKKKPRKYQQVCIKFHDSRAASKSRSSSTHSVHLVCTSRAFSSKGLIVSGVRDKARLLSPSCSGSGAGAGVGGGAERTEPVNLPRREDVRRGLLLFPLSLLSARLVCSCAWSLSSCASAISSTFDRRVGRRYVDGVTVLVCGNGGVAAGGDLVAVVVVAARDTCERDPVGGDSAHSDDDDD